MKLIITLCMALLFLAPQLARAGECYTPDEFIEELEQEQLNDLREHLARFNVSWPIKENN